MKKLYRFNLNCGRMGCLTGLFVVDEQDIQKAIGQYVYFGEVLGKHSEIECRLEEKHFTMLTDDQSFIEKFVKFNCESGTNPIDYLNNDDK